MSRPGCATALRATALRVTALRVTALRATALLAGLLAAGCAPLTVSLPANDTSRTGASAPAPGPAAGAEGANERPTPVPPQSVGEGGASTAVAAVRAFAGAYINWTAATVSDDMRTLAGQSVGQARSAMELAAAQTAQDYELQQSGVANQGTIAAIAPRAGHAGQYVVVTVEQTTASATDAYAGLAAAWHVALATVTQIAPGRWAVSGWQPEN